MMFVFNQFGDLERCALRPGNVHSAEGWRVVLEPVIARVLGSRGINPACPSVGRGDRAMGMLEVTLSAAISITWAAAVVICASRLSIDDV